MGDMQAALNDMASHASERLIVVKNADCCPICAAEEDPLAFMDGGLHPSCRCRVFEVDDEEGRTNAENANAARLAGE